MRQGSDEQKMITAARAAAVVMERNNPARQIIYDLVNAFEKLHREHDVCAISRPINVVVDDAPSSCACPGKLGNIKLCRNHAIDRLTWIGKTSQPHYAIITPLESERKDISDALARDIKVTHLPSIGGPRQPGTPKPLDKNKLAALNILTSIPGTVVKTK